MMRTTNPLLLNEEFSNIKFWKDLYQWKRIVSIGNTELISEMILLKIQEFKWSERGLRLNNFKLSSHQGYCQLQTEIKQFTEKRFCRAIYNSFKSTPNKIIGQILDYEVPLTQPNQGESKIVQGDIDLISISDNKLMLFEVKKAKSTESLLKAILEIFVYTYRLVKFDRINTLKKEYGLEGIPVVPCILTFNDSTSGKQLLSIEKFRALKKLIVAINKILLSKGVSALEFYSINSITTDYSNLLDVEKPNILQRKSKIIFKEDLLIRKYEL